MRLGYNVKKKDSIQTLATAFLPKKVLIPLEQERGIVCSPLVRAGDRIQEGQVIAEDYAGEDSAKIHSPIPGMALGIRKCSMSDGRYGDAIEIKLGGSFSHIGKAASPFDWKSWGANSLLNRTSALGVLNTFSIRSPRSLSSDIKAVKASEKRRIFVRLFDEDPACQTDSALARSAFGQILTGVEILKEIMAPDEVVFAAAKGDQKIGSLLSEAGLDEAAAILFMDTKNYPAGRKEPMVQRYRKAFKLQESERGILDGSLFIDAESLALLADAVVYNIPVERVYVHAFGDCLKSSAVLKVCVGESFSSLARQLGLEQKKIGKIVVNGFLLGRSVPSLETPVSKDVKSVAFISKKDLVDYSSAVCISCGNCRASCPAKIYPDIIYARIARSIKIPQDFEKSSLLCIECGVCNSVCPAKLPLGEIVKILKDRQNA